MHAVRYDVIPRGSTASAWTQKGGSGEMQFENGSVNFNVGKAVHSPGYNDPRSCVRQNRVPEMDLWGNS